jgi:hypothetical protein
MQDPLADGLSPAQQFFDRTQQVVAHHQQHDRDDRGEQRQRNERNIAARSAIVCLDEFGRLRNLERPAPRGADANRHNERIDFTAAATAHDFDRPPCRNHSASVRTFDNFPGLQRVGKHRHAAFFVKQNDTEDSRVITQVVDQPLGVADPPGAVAVFQRKL